MDVHSNETSSVNPYQCSKIKPEEGLKNRFISILRYFRRDRKKQTVTTSSSIRYGKKIRTKKDKVSLVSKQVFKEEGVGTYRGKDTISYNDLKKIIYYIDKNREKLFEEPRLYRKEEISLPNTIQVQVPKNAKNSNDMIIHVHLKSEINEGGEKFIKLSFCLGMKNKEIIYVATGTPIAASKKINPNPKQNDLLKAKKRFEKEIAMLKRFKSKKGIIQLKGYTVYAVKGYSVEQRPKVNMIFEIAEDDFCDYLIRLSDQAEDVQQEWKNNPKRLQYSLNILQGLDNIHKEGVIHLDIKLDNIFLVKGKAKIGDFGFATDAANANVKFRGTPTYLSPEILKFGKFTFEANSYPKGSQSRIQAESLTSEHEQLIGQKTDVYSTGICLYCLKYLKFPGYINGRQIDENDIAGPKRLDGIIQSIQKWYESFQPEDKEGLLIKDMMNPDPRARITAAEALDRIKKL